MGISIGIVGVGAFGRGFVPLAKMHPDVDRLALCDLNPDLLSQVAAEFQVTETYSSLDEICRSDLQALMIITQHWMHAPQAVQAMKAGKHVYTAVPCAWSLEECDQLVETVNRTGQLYMNGETSYFRPEAAFCRAKHAAGEFGEIVYCEGEYFHDMDHGLYEVARRRLGKEFCRWTQGGVPMSYPTHSTAAIISLTGAHMTEVSCFGHRMTGDDWFRKDTQSGCPYGNEIALFRLSNGATARICEFRRIGHPGCERNSIYGTQGSFECGVLGCAWATKDGFETVNPPRYHEPLPDPLRNRVNEGHGGSEVYLVNEFVSAVRDERLPRINVWQAARYWAPGFVAHQSAMRDGELLKIPDWGDPPG